MPKAFPELRDELREHLLRAGVAPRHVRRYLTELREHFVDLAGEEEHSGRGSRGHDSDRLHPQMTSHWTRKESWFLPANAVAGTRTVVPVKRPTLVDAIACPSGG
jgi:hypothetical protein